MDRFKIPNDTNIGVSHYPSVFLNTNSAIYCTNPSNISKPKVIESSTNRLSLLLLASIDDAIATERLCSFNKVTPVDINSTT